MTTILLQGLALALGSDSLGRHAAGQDEAAAASALNNVDLSARQRSSLFLCG